MLIKLIGAIASLQTIPDGADTVPKTIKDRQSF